MRNLSSTGSLSIWPQQRWAGLKSRDRSFFQGAEVGDRAQVLESFFIAFPDTFSRELDWKQSSWNWNQHRYGIVFPLSHSAYIQIHKHQIFQSIFNPNIWINFFLFKTFGGLFLKTDLYIWTTKYQRYRVRSSICSEREMFCRLVHSSNGCNGQHVARLKSGARSSIQVPHMSIRSLNGWAIFHCFPRDISKELHWMWSSQYSNYCCDRRWQHCRRQFS